MNDAQRKMMEKLGLSEADFEPKPRPEERLDVLQTTTDDIVLMLADIIGGDE